MAVAILISLWIYDEVSFNKNFKDHDRIAQVIQNVTNNGEVQTWWSVPYPLAGELRKNYGSDFKHLAMAVNWSDHLITIDQNKLKANGAFFEKEMPDMFTLDMINGNRNSLNDPSSVLISASAAKAWFGNENAVGKVFKIDEMQPVKVCRSVQRFSAEFSISQPEFCGELGFLVSQ